VLAVLKYVFPLALDVENRTRKHAGFYSLSHHQAVNFVLWIGSLNINPGSPGWKNPLNRAG